MGDHMPAWLLAAVDQRVALMTEHMPEMPFDGIIVTPLTEPPEGATDQQHASWDKSCDNCGTYRVWDLKCGEVTRMFRGSELHIMFGACPDCAVLP